MQGLNFLSDKERQQEIIGFDKQVFNRRGNALIRSSPESFLTAADEGQFDRLGEDQVLKMREQARTGIEREERRQDRIGREVKEQAKQGWYSALANNQLADSDIQEAIDKKNPSITPEEALHFKKLKQEGVSGDKVPVTGIMSGYYATGRSLPAIERTRRELRALQAQVGPNDFINKALNELQSDQTVLENQGISRDANQIQRDNRAIADLQNNLEANRAPGIPAIEKLYGNTHTIDKAKVKDIYKKEGKQAAEDFVKSKTAETKEKVNSIPTQQKKVIEATR